VLLECLIPTKHILLSDFTLWHHVLNNWYIPIHDLDEVQFAERCKDAHPDCERLKVQSWQRIFDLDWAATQHYTNEEKPIQGVLWEIQRAQVQRVQFFTAR
jgi:hypothetical protein